MPKRNDDRIAAPFLRNQFVFGELLLHAVGIGIRFVHFVDGYDDRHARSLGMVDRLDGLRHNAVVRRDDQNDNIRNLCAARTHGRKRFMARRVDKRDLPARARNGIGADMLRDAAGLALGHAAVANRVEQRGFSVVDMTHDRDHRRTGLEQFGIVRVVGRAVGKHFFIRLCDLLFEFDAEVGGDQFAGIEVDFLIDGRHNAEHKQPLDDFRGRFADFFAEFFYRYRFRCDHRFLDHDGFGPTNGLLFAAALGLAAARPAVIFPIPRAWRRFARNRFLAFLLFIIRTIISVCTGVRIFVGNVIAHTFLCAGGGCRLSSCRGARRILSGRRALRPCGIGGGTGRL